MWSWGGGAGSVTGSPHRLCLDRPRGQVGPHQPDAAGGNRHDDRSARAASRATERGLRRAARALPGSGPGVPPPQRCAHGRERLPGVRAVRARRRGDRRASAGVRCGRAAAHGLCVGERGAGGERARTVGHDSRRGHSARLDLASRAGRPADGAGSGRGEGVAAASRRPGDDRGGSEQAGYASAARRPGPRTSGCRRAPWR